MPLKGLMALMIKMGKIKQRKIVEKKLEKVMGELFEVNKGLDQVLVIGVVNPILKNEVKNRVAGFEYKRKDFIKKDLPNIPKPRGKK